MTAARTPLSGAAPVAPAPFEPSRGYRLNPDVALRPEPFGALAYHFGTRRLSFLKAPGLVDLVRELDRHPSVTDALAAVPEGSRDGYLQALAALAATDMIVSQPDPGEPT
jgi:putative mycofactocin binding protein MftB